MKHLPLVAMFYILLIMIDVFCNFNYTHHCKYSNSSNSKYTIIIFIFIHIFLLT